MLSLPPSFRLFVATQLVDGRKGADSLMVLVRDVLKLDLLSGHLFVFFSNVATESASFTGTVTVSQCGRSVSSLENFVRRCRQKACSHYNRKILS